jgi:hypothetical protein
MAAGAIACFVVGSWLRIDYLRDHHPRHYASSDAADYLERAQAWLAVGATERIDDTIWPPGTPALLALLSALDPGQELGAYGNALAGLLVVLLTAASVSMIAGKRAGWIALALAALHPGFIHYQGFFLAEQPFQLSVALALFLSVSALTSLDQRAGPGWLAGVAIGIAWGLAALFRANALPVVGGASLAVGLLCFRTRDRRALRLGVGLALGLCVVLSAAAQRCTAVSGGRFCLVSNNVAMNIALGQAGQVMGLEFRDDAAPTETSAWVPPALLHHGYKGMGRVPATIYDSGGVLRWVGQRFIEDPVLFVVRAVGNALDLFGLDYWPDGYGDWPERAVMVWRQLWNALVLIPAIYCAARLTRTAWRPTASPRDDVDKRRPMPAFLLGSLAGLLFSAAVSLGEARYRIPFDAIFIALASAVYAQSACVLEEGTEAPTRITARRWSTWAVALGLCVAILLGISHPSLKLGRHLPQRETAFHGPWETSVAREDATHLRAVRAAGSAWDLPGNFIWQCTPNCPELRIRPSVPPRARRVSVSLDHNDRYRLSLYRAGTVVGHIDVSPTRAIQGGMQTLVLPLPDNAQTFDTVGIQPCYGDGRYSLGHLIVE